MSWLIKHTVWLGSFKKKMKIVYSNIFSLTLSIRFKLIVPCTLESKLQIFSNLFDKNLSKPYSNNINKDVFKVQIKL